ncbi:hypothetical protein BKA61DRAFT_562960 [Leptodontidium sp. MPI-SDFR-AT-0119]|nr:hypothetical protein BKA61DRAFT_562960 [Leptodontidium sp. MPI-SDFR-AT-0119]
MASTIETLPLLILERICEYLDSGSTVRPSLLAFSLSSRTCHIASAAQIFSQIELKIYDPQYLSSTLSRWNTLLTSGRHGHVRRLKISFFEIAEEKARDADRWHREMENMHEEEGDEWNSRHYFHMHDFCRPSHEDICHGGGSIRDRESESWDALSQFISEFPGLKDLVWSAGYYVPPAVLSMAAERGTRLHVHHFSLPSLIQIRDEHKAISKEDYALCTHPSLYSIAFRVGSYESGGLLNYGKEAVMEMVAGLAPNLAHLCVISQETPGELEIDQAMALGKPAWKGFFPGEASCNDTIERATARSSTRGKFQSLVFPDFVPRGIDHWVQHADFSVLRSIVMLWQLSDGIVLAEVASRGDLRSLEKLDLSAIEDETEQSQNALNLLLSSLSSLERLELSGYISPKTFEIIVHRHGESLHALSLDPVRDVGNDSRNPLVTFSGSDIQLLASNSPHLTHLRIPINRTRSDEHEVATYRALAKLPSLRHLVLTLRYTIGPDEEFWDEEVDGEHPFNIEYDYDSEGEETRPTFLRETWTNIAVDAPLALSIFNTISSADGGLEYLRLTLVHKEGFSSRGCRSSTETSAMRWFARPWICKRDGGGVARAIAFEEKETAVCGRTWERMLGDEEQLWYEEMYQPLYREIWPQKTADWKNDWESIPLWSEETTE